MIQSVWQLRSNDGEIVKFQHTFHNLSKILESQDIEEIVDVAINEATLKVILRFCEIHEYSTNSINIKRPIVSKIFKENVDPKTFLVLQEFSGLGKAQLIAPIIEAGYFLDFEEFRNCCLCALACDFYIGNTEEDLARHRAVNSIKDLSPEEELQIQMEYEIVFQRLNEKIQAQVLEEISKQE